MSESCHTIAPTGTDTQGTLSKMERLRRCFTSVMTEVNEAPAMTRLASGQFTVEHYKEYLRQIFHYTRENPQLQTLAASHFRGSDRDTVSMYFKHATSEIGHDRLALNDLESMGEDVSEVPYQNPLPATVALNAFAYYQVQCRNPIGHLGYLYFLEYLPTSSGAGYMKWLEHVGVPTGAMTFIAEHAQIDIGHNRLMDLYVERLIHTPEDLETVMYSMRVTGRLFCAMLLAAIEQADTRQDWGVNGAERRRQRRGAPLPAA